MNKMKNIKKDDEYETPLYAVKIIEKYLKRDSVIWCPFDKEHSNFVRYFYEMGHEVLYSHIDMGYDFLTCEVPKGIDYIISNPPFSIKDKIYERLFDIDVSFAMLMNLQGFCDSKIRAKLFSENEIQVMYIYPRIKYMKDGEEMKSNIFQSGYVCKNVLPKDLVIHVEDK